MRAKIISSLLAICMLGVLIHGGSAGGDVLKNLVAHRAVSEPTLDGVMSPGEWRDAKRYKFANGFDLRLKNTESTLYIGLEVEDSTPVYPEYEEGVIKRVDLLAIHFEPVENSSWSYSDGHLTFIEKGVTSRWRFQDFGIEITENSSSKAEWDVTRRDDSYVYEIELKRKALGIQELIVPFNIHFIQYKNYGRYAHFSTSRYLAPINFTSLTVRMSNFSAVEDQLPYLAYSVAGMMALLCTYTAYKYQKTKTAKR